MYNVNTNFVCTQVLLVQYESTIAVCWQVRAIKVCSYIVKVKMHTLDIAPLRSESPPQSAQVYGTCSQGISQFYLHTNTFIRFSRNRNEPYLPLPSQPQLVLIYRPRKDGRLSRRWCEVAQAEIRICNLPVANPALYYTATSAH